jgi:hypothetical protein
MIVIIILVAFLAGAIAGVVALVRVGIAREESDKSLPGAPTTRAGAATRRIVGWHADPPGRAAPGNRGTDEAKAGPYQRPMAAVDGR